MVIRIGAGEIGSSVSRLAQDVRSMMEPNTASRLKERRTNRLRDYTAMAGPLGVSHLLLFSRSEAGNVGLRIALTPRGPTMNFRVDQYSLAKDVRNGQRRPFDGQQSFKTSPLLVMNNFNSSSLPEGSQNTSAARLESLTTTVFQSLFPSISPHKRPLSSIRRVVLLTRIMPDRQNQSTSGDYVLVLRHFAIITKPANISRGLRRLHTSGRKTKGVQKGKKTVPDLAGLGDMSELLLDSSAVASGFTSATESEPDTEAEIEVSNVNIRNISGQEHGSKAQNSNFTSRRNAPEKRKVSLVELGPRMKMSLVKVEEGVCSGKTLYHSHFSKTSEEVERMNRIWQKRQQEKDERRQTQKANLERKQRQGNISAQSNEELDDGDTDSGTDLLED